MPEKRTAKALINGQWQEVTFYGLFQVVDIDYANVLAVVETKSGNLRKVDINNVQLETLSNQTTLFENDDQ